jgi:hypothetical protein
MRRNEETSYNSFVVSSIKDRICCGHCMKCMKSTWEIKKTITSRMKVAIKFRSNDVETK